MYRDYIFLKNCGRFITYYLLIYYSTKSVCLSYFVFNNILYRTGILTNFWVHGVCVCVCV